MIHFVGTGYAIVPSEDNSSASVYYNNQPVLGGTTFISTVAAQKFVEQQIHRHPLGRDSESPTQYPVVWKNTKQSKLLVTLNLFLFAFCVVLPLIRA